MHSIVKVIGFSFTVATLAACSTTGEKTNAGTDKAPADSSHATLAPVTNAGLSAADLAALKDAKSPLSRRSVYFAYDNYQIQPEQRSVIETHGPFLAARHSAKITIEGHADERGSREYNLALGQRRAEAVRKALAVYGVADSQMEAISFGSEKPVAKGHDEESWAKNRRADIRYAGE
jgi:peptidoglycan-associated lipoprotein